jgi:hypothetical protein
MIPFASLSFKFVVLNSKLQSEQNKDFLLKIKTEGKVVPENAMIFIDGESYFMENSKPGVSVQDY